MNLKNIIEKLAQLIDTNGSFIDITNIATLNDGDEFLLSKTAIILSIVNIEEDKTLKNQSVYLKDTMDGTKIEKHRHPAKHYIISLLFSSYNKDLAQYLEGIEKLNFVMNYFQQNTALYYKKDESELIDYTAFLTKDPANYSKITLETVSLSMEQLNQMWSYLGSKYMPSVLIKMRIVSVQSSIKEEDKVIDKFTINLWENNINDPTGLLEEKIHPYP